MRRVLVTGAETKCTFAIVSTWTLIVLGARIIDFKFVVTTCFRAGFPTKFVVIAVVVVIAAVFGIFGTAIYATISFTR